MLTRMETIRRLVLASACWSGCATIAVSLPSHLAAADRNPTPRKLWSPLKGRATKSETTPTVPAGRPLKVQNVVEADVVSDTDAKTSAHPAGIKLNYLSSEWKKVLEDVAKSSDSKLVLMDEPPGRFSRQDWSGRYTRTEAVQILNRELEPQGYRLLEKDEFLTVIHVQRQRMEYQRPLQAAVEPRALQPVPDSGVTRAVGQNINSRGGIQRVMNEQVEGAAPAQQAVEAAPAAVPVAAVHVTQTFDPLHRSALELSKQVLKAFDSRKEMVDSGPTGLPGFEVYGPPDEETSERGPKMFALELDLDNERIYVHGKSDVAERMVKLLARLDGLAATNAGQAVQFIPGDDRAADIATRIRPVVKQLAQFQQGSVGAGNAATRPNAPEAPPADGADPDVIDAVQSNVIIEVYEGSIILRGTKKDVDAVTRMIRAIENAAQGSLPEAHLMLLSNVDARQLTEIVNDVYTELATLRNRSGSTNNVKQVTAIAIGVPNAVLLLSPQTQLDSAIELVKKLDVPVAPDMQMQVFGLRSAVASQVLEHVNDLFPANTTEIAATALAVADVRTNSLVVMARPRDMKTITDLVNKLDRDSSAAVIMQRQFRLQYAVAQDLATFLSLSIQSVLNPPTQQTQQGQGQAGGQVAGGGATQGPQELRDSKAVVIEFLSTDGNADRIVRSGLLSDVRVIADPRTNTLMVTAPETSMALLAELIRVLDVQSNSVSDFKVFTLDNADAVTAVTTLTELFSAANQAGGQGNTPGGIQLQGTQDVASSLVPVQFSADARTNSVIASGGPAALELVEAILERLDSSNAMSRSTDVIRLRNTSAVDVELALNTFLQSIRELAQLDPERTTTNQLLQQEILVAAEPVTNSLLVSATPRYMEDVKRIINQLDREPDQVMIQAILVQVNLSGNCEFGVELGFQDDILFNRSSTAGVPGFLFNNANLGNNTATPNPSLVGGQGLSNFGVGRTSDLAGFGGLVLAASSNSVSVLIRALEGNTNAQVLSRPSIMALDNQVAEITVGQIVPRPQGVTTGTNGVSQPTFADTNVGIILSVIPRITPEGKIIMELIANNSALSGESVPLFTNTDGSATVSSPIINQSKATTVVKVPDGQTIVVGGMITSTDSQASRKVPWLGDLPVIGHAFRYDQQSNDRSELIIFLTPRIVRRDLDSEIIKQVEAERLHFFETDVETMHGPLYGVPRPDWTENCPPQGVPVVPGTNIPSHLPPGSIMPDGQVPAGATIPSMQLDYVPQAPIPMVEPGTNSKRVRGEYGEAYGRRPLPH
jgi:general secretion pathway protein D